MEHCTKADKLKSAAEVVCKQGMVQFPVSDTAIAIIDRVVGDNEEELDLIYAFREKPSQTMDQLGESSGFSTEKIEQLATSIAKKGLIFNQASSSGVMIYRLLPLMLVGVMEYKFMVELTGSEEEKELAGLFEKLLEELRDEIQDNFDALSPFFNSAPAVDRTVPTRNVDPEPLNLGKSGALGENFMSPQKPHHNFDTILSSHNILREFVLRHQTESTFLFCSKIFLPIPFTFMMSSIF